MLAHRLATPDTPHKWLDMVCVLERGLISNRTRAKTFDALPEFGCALVDSAVSRPLVVFFALMTQYLAQATAPRFDLGHYFKFINFNTSQIVTAHLGGRR